MRVSIYHNVAQDEAGRFINFLGYKSGHPLVHVLEIDVDQRASDTSLLVLAEQVWAACNIDPQLLTGRMAVMARAYRQRLLRSLSIGDVVVITEGDDRVAMWADNRGFQFVRADSLTIVTRSGHGTTPWLPGARPTQV